MSRYRKSMAETMAEVERIGQELPEVAPPGWEGSVKAMKKHKDIDNPWALAWHMKNKGDKPHYKDQDGKPEKKEKYKEDVDEANLPPHLAKFFDKKGNPKPDAAKRMADGQKKREVKYKTKDVTPKGYGPNEEVEEAYESPLDSPKAKAAREKLKKVLKGIKKKDPDHPAVQNVKEEEIEEGGAYGGGLKDAAKKVRDAEKRLGIRKDKTTVTKTKHGEVRKTTYKGKIDMGQKREEVEIDEVNKHQARAFGSALIRDKSPLDSPKAKAAREKLQKVMKDIKKKDPDHPAVQGIKDEVELTPEALDLQKVRAQRRAQAAKRMKDVEKVFNKKTKPSKDMKVPPRMDDPDRGYFEEVEIDELSNKTMDSYAKKASASQADAEKKQDYKTADKRIAGKLRATRRKFSNDTNKILDRLKNNTTTEEMDFKVKLKGLPSFYVPGKSAAAVRMMLRRQVKRPDDIESVDRVTKSSKRKDFRLRGQGKDLSSKDDD